MFHDYCNKRALQLRDITSRVQSNQILELSNALQQTVYLEKSLLALIVLIFVGTVCGDNTGSKEIQIDIHVELQLHKHPNASLPISVVPAMSLAKDLELHVHCD